MIMSNRTCIINGITTPFQHGQSVLEVAHNNGIEIPTLCYHKHLSVSGNCRLCIVEVKGDNKEETACTLQATDGLVISTETDNLITKRKAILNLLLMNYRDVNYGRYDDHANEFMHWIRHYNIKLPKDFNQATKYRIDSDPNPFIRVDLNQCILCSRCERACNEIQGRFVWSLNGRGAQTELSAGVNEDLLQARCESCGACAEYCPTGALTDKLSEPSVSVDKQVTTTCTYCGVGCNFDLQVKNDRVVGVKSNHQAVVNGAHLCVKGRYGYDFIHHQDRLTRPKVRRYLLENRKRQAHENRGDWVEVDWDTAIKLASSKLLDIKQQSGADSIGVLSSAKCTNEENYLMQKFARQIIGTHNIDHCARLCHSSTVAGLAASFGSGAMTNTMADIAENSKSVLIIGSNTTEQHPVFGSMLRQAVIQHGLKIVVADPRAIDITEFSALHIRQQPGTDVALVNGLMHIILQNNWHDKTFIGQRTEGFEAFQHCLANYTPEKVSGITGITETELQQAAEILALNSPMAVIWSMGITQHTTGVMNVLNLANLQMLLGNMGIEGGGVNPLRGQNNVQGACDMGALPNVFPAYQKTADENSSKKFATAWALDGDTVNLFSDNPGLTVTEMIAKAGEGEVRGLYIMGENPIMSDPDINHVRSCLQKTEFLILQEIFPSETSEYADILLPGVSFAEKEGTFTNTERRVQRVRQAIPEIGEAKADWRIIQQLANTMLSVKQLKPTGSQAAWDYHSPADIQAEIATLAPSYQGVNYQRLDTGEQLHWPVKSVDHAGTPILHVGQFTCGKGKFTACEHMAADEVPNQDYPYILTTGRVLYHWHGSEMTRRAKGLLAVYPETLIEINPEDAEKISLQPGGKIRVKSVRGETVARAMISERVSVGLIFGNFHFPQEQNINNVTNPALDPVAKIPEYKVCAVQIETVK